MGGWPAEVIGEVWAQRVAHALPLAVVAASAWALSVAWRRLPRGHAFVGAALVAAGLVWGLRQALASVWLADDALISFRYAENWANGLGFVFNPGERVEGYTNFLLVFVLGVVRQLGGSVPHAALGLDLLAFATLVVVAALLPATASGERAFPWAALAVAASRPFHVFATSGLEAEVALGLAALGVLLWRRERLTAASVLLGLGGLARPDFLLVAGAVWLADLLSATGPGRVRRLVRFVAPGLGVFAAWWAWRWWYYGDFFPNTFHAKSGGGAYWEQGLVYLTHGFFASGALVLVPVLLAGLVALPRRAPAWPLALLAVTVAALDGVYVVRVGGDFMEFRFLLPTLYFVIVGWGAVATGLGERWVRARSVLPWLAACALCLGVVAQDVRAVAPGQKRWHLAAEESFYRLDSVFPLKASHFVANLAQELKAAFEGTGVRPKLAIGVIGYIGYYSGLPLTDTYGLTCREVARSPILKRGRPGHEKFATPEQMYDDGAVFSDAVVWPGTEEALKLTLGGRPWWLIHHDEGLEALARKRGWRYPNFDALTAAVADTVTSEAELAEQRTLYEKLLRGTKDAERLLGRLTLDEVRRRIERARVGPASEVPARLRQAEGLGLAEDAQALRARVVARYDFEDDERPAGVPDAFWPPTAGAAERQTPVSGFHGRRLLNTYLRGDGGTGRFELPLPPEAAGGWLGLLVGGGSDCTKKYVALVDGEREVARWCGANTEVLRPVGASLAGLVAPKLVLVDEDAGAWGHLLLDDVLVAQLEPAR